MQIQWLLTPLSGYRPLPSYTHPIIPTLLSVHRDILSAFNNWARQYNTERREHNKSNTQNMYNTQLAMDGT